MSEAAAHALTLATAGYLGLGALVALPFVIVGVGRVTAGGKGSSVLFRVIILPGVAALWPVVLVKWVGALRDGSGSEEDAQDDAHEDAS